MKKDFKKRGKMVVLAALVLLFAIAVVMAVPVTWLLMLFLGNIGVHVGFWACIPGGILLGLIKGGVEAKS